MSNYKHPLYHKWRNMIDYTTNPNIQTYWSQGDKGIKVCKRWWTFENFVEDIEQLAKPPGCDQLTRIDPAKDYRPGNAMWDTRKGYGQRRTDCHYVTYKGRRQNVKLWCSELGLSYSTTLRRLNSGERFAKIIKELTHG